MIIYLHGFRSSPQSFKAKLLAERMQTLNRKAEYLCPQLPVSPKQAINEIGAYVEGYTLHDPQTVTVIGSSLGGFYATWLAEHYGCKCVLLNPAVHPWTDLQRYVGEQPLYHGKGTITIRPEYMDELLAMRVESITQPERYRLIAATGDEVLDYREMLAHYPKVTTTLIEGGDHGLSNFALYMDEVLAFSGVDPHEVNRRISWRITI